MRTVAFIAALLIALLTGCGDGPDRRPEAAALGAPPPEVDGVGVATAEDQEAPAANAGDRPTQKSTSDTAAPAAGGGAAGSSRTATGDNAPASGGPQPPPDTPVEVDDGPGSEPNPGDGSRPPGAVRVASGQTNASTQWTLDAYRDDGETCGWFTVRPQAGGGGAAAGCGRPPLDPSTLRAGSERFAFGMTSSQVVRVRFEHAGGGSETFEPVASPYSERFFGGEIAGTPLTRIVALDANGKVVAERTDMTAYNAS